MIALTGKATALKNLERYDEALEQYDKVLAIDLTDIHALNDKAIILQNLKRYDEAIGQYDKALSIDPTIY